MAPADDPYGARANDPVVHGNRHEQISHERSTFDPFTWLVLLILLAVAAAVFRSYHSLLQSFKELRAQSEGRAKRVEFCSKAAMPTPRPRGSRQREMREEEHGLTTGLDDSSVDVEGEGLSAKHLKNSRRSNQQEKESLLEESCAERASSGMATGTRVTIHGLKSAAYQNGKGGLVLGPHDTSDRLRVRLDTGEVLALKKANLRACDAAPQISVMIAALERAGEFEKAALLRKCET